MNKAKPTCDKLLLILFSLFFLLFLGCEEKSEITLAQPAAPKPNVQEKAPTAEVVKKIETTVAAFMSEPVVLNRFESISEALPVWREFADLQPTLLLLSDKPQLILPPELLRDPIDHLMKAGNPEAIITAGKSTNPEQLFQHSMTVDIALRNKWFSNLDWIFPSRDPEAAPNLDLIRDRFTEYSILNETEANSLTLEDKTIKGKLRDVSFRASALKWAPKQNSPAIIHIDLSYFQTLYKNEIATPVLQTVYSTLSQLKALELTPLTVTFSYGHMDNNIALDVRFLGEVLKTLIADPELLNKPVPANWKRQADAIYMANFFQKENIEEIFKAQQQDDSSSAWIKFNLYRSAAEMKSGQQALDYLAEAVTLDPVYALEYANLSQMAYDKKRPTEALRMLSLASRIYPDDPFIKLRTIQLSIELGENKTALHLVEQLQALAWSDIYYSAMPERLNLLAEELQEAIE